MSVIRVFIVLSLLLTSATALAAPPTKEQCIAANEAVQYLREAHALKSAREKLLICVSEACPAPVRQDCARRLDEVERLMPSLALEVKDARGSDVVGVKITMDGQPLAAATGTAIELDPGEHAFVFEAPGMTRVDKTLVAVEGVKGRRESIRMDWPFMPVKIPPAPTPTSGPPTLAWTAFGVGGADLAVGVVTGLVAAGKHSTLASECSTTTCAPQYAGDLNAFHTWRTVSTVGYVIGALGVAGGAVLWFTAPKTNAASAWVGPASVGIGGRF